ncbi:MAG: cation-translocating P-type ATPase [Negativicutes bacterium]|jgi:Cu+-exporting ATPase
MNRTLNISIQGMHCAGCAGKIERALKLQNGVVNATVILALNRAKIVFEEKLVLSPLLISLVSDFGYTVTEIPADVSLVEQAEDMQKSADAEKHKYKITFQLSALLTLPLLMYLGLAASGQMDMHNKMALYVQMLFSGLVQIIGGRIFYRGAWNDLRKWTIGMDMLVAAGTSIVYLFSVYAALFTRHQHAFFETSALLIAFILFGKWLEIRARGDATAALRQLMQNSARTATVLIDSAYQEIAAAALLPGDVFVLRAGDVAPADGSLLTGEALFDESMLTGEALPVFKSIDSKIFSGTVNVDGAITVVVEKVAADSVLAKIVDALMNAQQKRPKLQRIADRIAAKFSLVVFFLAIVTFLLWLFVFAPGDFSAALWRAAAVLVAACPCAIGLATPLAIMAATGRALKLGMVFRDGEALERAASVDCLIFDKTGTLTTNQPIVESMDTFNKFSDSDCIKLAASLGSLSKHPFSKTLAMFTTERLDLSETREIIGKGIIAMESGREVLLGSARFMRENAIDVVAATADMAGNVYLAVAGQLAAEFKLADKLRDNAKRIVETLIGQDIKPIIASGDTEASVVHIAEATGISEYYYALTPFDKIELVKKLQLQSSIVAMCGDGINDAVALAGADVGIAVAQGADVAQLSAAVNVLRDDLELIAEIFVISRATIRNIKQNFAWAIVYNIVMLPLAMFSDISPALCGLAMSLSSVSVALNALRLRSAK